MVCWTIVVKLEIGESINKSLGSKTWLDKSSGAIAIAIAIVIALT